MAHLVTPYGCILKPMSAVNKTGVMVYLPIACPLSSLTYALEESDGLRSLFKQRLTLKPSSPEDPWTIVLYCDEVTPGNPLASLNRSRFHSFYWSLIELGTEALSHEESWFILMTEFSTGANGLQGGLSACFVQPLRLSSGRYGHEAWRSDPISGWPGHQAVCYAGVGSPRWWRPQICVGRKRRRCLQVLHTVQQIYGPASQTSLPKMALACSVVMLSLWTAWKPPATVNSAPTCGTCSRNLLELHLKRLRCCSKPWA